MTRLPRWPTPVQQRRSPRFTWAHDHTLLVLQKIAELVDDLRTPGFAVYVSDHGENVLSDHNGIRFHAGPRTTIEAAYVPAMVFWNAAFEKSFQPMARLQKYLSASRIIRPPSPAAACCPDLVF